MALLALLVDLRGFPVAVYRRTLHHKPLCSLNQDKNFSFLNWTLNWVHYTSWADINIDRKAQVFCWAKSIASGAL